MDAVSRLSGSPKSGFGALCRVDPSRSCRDLADHSNHVYIRAPSPGHRRARQRCAPAWPATRRPAAAEVASRLARHSWTDARNAERGSPFSSSALV
jgi:hypothetical protein